MKTFDLTHVPIQEKKAIRQMHSKAVLSTDLHGLQEYKDKQTQMEAVKKTTERLESLEGDVGEIKAMLRKLVYGV